MVRIPGFHCHGSGSISGQGTVILGGKKKYPHLGKSMKEAQHPGYVLMWTSSTTCVRVDRTQWMIALLPKHETYREKWNSKQQESKNTTFVTIKSIEGCRLGSQFTVSSLNWTYLPPHRQCWTIIWKSRADCAPYGQTKLKEKRRMNLIISVLSLKLSIPLLP